MLTIIEAADSHVITTLGYVKTELGISGDDENANLQTWLDQASVAISKYCNRVFAQETVEETFRFRCAQDGILLSRFPVNEIVSINENGIALVETDYELSNGRAGTLARLRADRECHWPSGKVTVTYQTGFAAVTNTAGDIVDTGVPAGIQRAAAVLVGIFRSNAGRDPNVRELQHGDERVAFMRPRLDESGGLPAEVVILLDQEHKPAGG